MVRRGPSTVHLTRRPGLPHVVEERGADGAASLLVRGVAPDAAQVGMLTDNWIIGDTL